jgi:hypothetical protein
MRRPSIGRRHSQAHTSATLAAQAAKRQIVSRSWTRALEVWGLVVMAGNIRRFCVMSLGVSFFRDLRLVKDSESPRKRAEASQFAPETSIRMPAWLPSQNQQV